MFAKVCVLENLNNIPHFSELNALKSKCLSDDAVSVAAVPQRQPFFFTVPWHIKLEIYRKLEGDNLINFHLAFPQSTSELAPFYYLKSNFGYEDYQLWPVIKISRVPGPIELELIHAAYNLTLKLKVVSVKTFNGISDELRCRVTDLRLCDGNTQGRLIFNELFD